MLLFGVVMFWKSFGDSDNFEVNQIQFKSVIQLKKKRTQRRSGWRKRRAMNSCDVKAEEMDKN